MVPVGGNKEGRCPIYASPPDLATEIARLREALERILDAPLIDHSHPENSKDGIARAALADQKGGAAKVPSDVTNLVIAARDLLGAYDDMSEEFLALDKALEAFSSRIPYENEPEENA